MWAFAKLLPWMAYGMVIQQKGLSLSGTKHFDQRRQRQSLRDHRLCIVVALQQVHRNLRGVQLCHGCGKEKPRPHVLPLTIEDVTCNDDKVDRLRNRERDQCFQRTPGCATDVFD